MATEQDDLAILLQEAVSELQASRKQTNTFKKLIDQNSDLTKKVTEVVACGNMKKKQGRTTVVSVHTKVLRSARSQLNI